MATLTPNYSLYKPAGTEFVNETTDLNNNWDIVDTQLKLVSDSIPTVLRKIKTANTDKTSDTTLAADPHLFVPIAANSIYLLFGWFVYSGAAAPAGGIQFDWTGPAGFSMRWSSNGVNGHGGVGALTDNDVVVINAADIRNHGTNLGTKMSMHPMGVVRTVGTAGTLALRWAQATSNATATTLEIDSFIRVEKYS